MKPEAAIIGAGCTQFGELFDKSYNDLIVEASWEAFLEAGILPGQIGGAWLSTAFPEVGVYKGRSGLDVTEALGLHGIPITRVSNYCASAGDAFRNAVNALMAGDVDVALVVGVEKQRDRSPQQSIVKMMVETGHPFYQKGFTAAGTFAVFANRYIKDFGLTPGDLAAVSEKNHAHSVLNPKAFYRKAIDRQTVLQSPMVADPLRLLDCCPTTDGAAAVVLARTEDAPRFKNENWTLVRGLGFCTASGWDQPFFDPEFEFTSFRGVKKAAEIAYAQAGISSPLTELSLAEVHDCFSISEIILYSDLGFCEKGQEMKLLQEGQTKRSGKLPVNVSGGLLSCGHPVGATGIRQIYEITRHLQGIAGERQVPGARLGLAQVFGGPGSVSSVIILSSRK
jgi:acetyl-CoA C-acetyltransferase